MRKLYLLNKILIGVFIFIASAAFAQDGVIEGKVTSSTDKNALPGVTVILKGTTNGTVTDVEGNYSLKAASTDTLIFSFVGYNNEIVPIASRTRVDVSMDMDMKTLSEVVVI